MNYIIIFLLCLTAYRMVVHGGSRNTDSSSIFTDITKPKILAINNMKLIKNNITIHESKIKGVTLEINGFGTNFILKVTRNDSSSCLFSGRLKNTVEGFVEIHLCNGVDGVFQWDHKVCFIKPRKLNKSNSKTISMKDIQTRHKIHYERFNFPTTFKCKLNQNQKNRFQTSSLKQLNYLNLNQLNNIPTVDKIVVKERRIELLIVVTSRLVKLLGKDINSYILNNIAIASNLLRHPTIETSIGIEIVDIIPLDPRFEVSNNLHDWRLLSLNEVVNRFCEWLKTREKFMKYRWDSAIIINDGGFSGNAIGIAHLGSMCGNDNCIAAVNRGFGTGFIIAHEIAHQLDAKHDFIGDKDCKIFEPEYTNDIIQNTIMSTRIHYENHPLIWSKCSQVSIENFFSSNQLQCLNDRNFLPNLYSYENITNHYHSISTGNDYDLDYQCSLAFGEPAVHCDIAEPSKKCSLLRCRMRRFRECFWMDALIADGTNCGDNKNCFNGNCVKKTEIVPIHGGWSNYSSWSSCTQPCGGGVQYSQRFCTNPNPKNGGRFCIGPKSRMRSCNTEPCKTHSNKREQFCERINLKYLYSSFEEKSSCKVICGQNYNYRRSVLIDGVPCNYYRSDICVKGKCYKTGCDNKIGSTKEFDNCNECNGNNDTCEIRKFYFDGTKHFRVNYMRAFTIPANVTNVFIKKISPRTTPFSTEIYDDYDLLLKIDDEIFYFSTATRERINGCELHHSGKQDKIESMKLLGKTEKEMKFKITTVNYKTRFSLPSIEYHYYIPKPSVARMEKYLWKFDEFDNQICWRRCNSQFETSVECVKETDNSRVADKFCNQQSKPYPIVNNCSGSCGYRWEIVENYLKNDTILNSCPLICGIGIENVLYLCKSNIENEDRKVWKIVSTNECSSAGLTNYLGLNEICVGQCERYQWSFDKWGKCEGPCLYGVQYRRVKCIDQTTRKEMSFSFCNSKTFKPMRRKCLLSELCGYWKAHKWSQCSANCGFGYKQRKISCFNTNGTKSTDYSICRNLAPATHTFCQDSICPTEPFWWKVKTSQCYVDSCEPGVSKVITKCVNGTLNVLPDSKCGERPFDDYYFGCLKESCLKFSWKVGPWNNCSTKNCLTENQKRLVQCVDDFDNVYNESFCEKASKPNFWKLCSSPESCSSALRNCKEIKAKFPESKDGEYKLEMNSFWNNDIYCYDMDKENPKEYLTLKYPNYARSSRFISVKENSSCVFNEEEASHAQEDSDTNSDLFSKTNYHKIRINLEDFSIDVMDNTFSETTGLVYMPYGTAKDCSDSTTCPKGHFKIDLRDTGFSVSVETKWNERYHRYGYKISRTHKSQVILGWCGGPCTGCSPIDKLHIVAKNQGQDYEEKYADLL